MEVKKRKGVRFSTVFALVMLALAAFVAALVVLDVAGRNPMPLAAFSSRLRELAGFGFSSPFALVPLAFLAFSFCVCTFLFRGRKPFSFLTFPLWCVIYATVNFLLGMHGENPHPACLYAWLVARTSSVRQASLYVVLAFLAECLLLVVAVMAGKPLNARYRKKKEFATQLEERKKVGDAEAQTGEEPLSAKETRRRAKEAKLAAKRERKAQKLAKRKEKSARDVPQEEECATVVVPDHAPDDALRFPSFMDVPEIDHLTRKNPSAKSDGQEPKHVPASSKEATDYGKGVVSVGALQVIKEEVEKTNPIKPPMPMQKPTPRRTLSGFLQGALEAVGKGPKPSKQQESRETSHGKGLLVEAVEENQRKHKELEEVGSSFSKTTGETQPAVPKERPVPPSHPEPIFYTPSGPIEVAGTSEPPQEPVQSPSRESTSVPVRSQDIPVTKRPDPQQEAPDDPENVAGVGGLQPTTGGKSALLNRQNLDYHYPSTSLLVDYPSSGSEVDATTLEKGNRLVQTLEEFHVKVELKDIIKGPTVTMFEIMPASGVRVTQIENLADNIQLRLPATQVRIVAPIPGKTVVGVEIPNAKRDTVGFKELIPAIDVKNYMIPMVLGKNLLGQSVVIDVASTPHLLIAGATGSGKSVCVNSLICSILFRKSPKQVRLILVDPKIVELQIYNGIPHLLTPVITEPKRTLKALDFCLWEMERRYKLLQGLNARNILGYNEKVKQGNILREPLPYIVVVIDEFADLMHTVGKEMESKVARLTAMSRAVGIHLVLATQRPSVNVITGIIKTNIPSRIAFAVTSGQDSRIIIDEMGAEKLLGRGDMLYISASDPAAARIQGAFLSDKEVEDVVAFAKSQGSEDYIDESFFEDEPEKGDPDMNGDESVIGGDDDAELMHKALDIVVERKAASASYLQRRLRIGYNRAARLVEEMEEEGYVGPANGSKPRPLLRYPGSVSLGQQDAGNTLGGEKQE